MTGYQTGNNTFSLDLARFAKRANVEMKLVVQKISMEAFKRIILRTPVDTGRARANWGCTIGSPRAAMQTYGRMVKTRIKNAEGKTIRTEMQERFDKSGNSIIKEMSDTVRQFPGDGRLFMVNNLPYIGELENGSSQQMPSGMVRATMAEMSGFMGSKATIESLKKATGPA